MRVVVNIIGTAHMCVEHAIIRNKCSRSNAMSVFIKRFTGDYSDSNEGYVVRRTGANTLRSLRELSQAQSAEGQRADAPADRPGTGWLGLKNNFS